MCGSADMATFSKFSFPFTYDHLEYCCVKITFLGVFKIFSKVFFRLHYVLRNDKMAGQRKRKEEHESWFSSRVQ